MLSLLTTWVLTEAVSPRLQTALRVSRGLYRWSGAPLRELTTVKKLVEYFLVASSICEETVMTDRFLAITLQADWRGASLKDAQLAGADMYQGEVLNLETPAQLFG